MKISPADAVCCCLDSAALEPLLLACTLLGALTGPAGSSPMDLAHCGPLVQLQLPLQDTLWDLRGAH